MNRDNIQALTVSGRCSVLSDTRIRAEILSRIIFLPEDSEARSLYI